MLWLVVPLVPRIVVVLLVVLLVMLLLELVVRADQVSHVVLRLLVRLRQLLLRAFLHVVVRDVVVARGHVVVVHRLLVIRLIALLLGLVAIPAVVRHLEPPWLAIVCLRDQLRYHAKVTVTVVTGWYLLVLEPKRRCVVSLPRPVVKVV